MLAGNKEPNLGSKSHAPPIRVSDQLQHLPLPKPTLMPHSSQLSEDNTALVIYELGAGLAYYTIKSSSAWKYICHCTVTTNFLVDINV